MTLLAFFNNFGIITKQEKSKGGSCMDSNIAQYAAILAAAVIAKRPAEVKEREAAIIFQNLYYELQSIEQQHIQQNTKS